jgi:hypothetical protein
MTRGYYSLVQYCPDFGRLEGVNLGVVLYCPETKYFGVRTVTSIHRIHRVFGKRSLSAERFERLRRSFEIRAERAAKGFSSVEDLKAFIGEQANGILVTEPRPVAVETPGVQLAELFGMLVEAVQKAKRIVGVKEKLATEFAKPEFENLVEHDVSIHLPAIRSSLVLPYGFQNGKYHVIQPVQFQRETAAEVVARTGRYRFESELIAEAEKQLVVVAEFPKGDNETPQLVERLLREKDAEFYEASRIEDLLQVIRTTAKPLDKPIF